MNVKVKKRQWLMISFEIKIILKLVNHFKANQLVELKYISPFWMNRGKRNRFKIIVFPGNSSGFD